MTAPGGKARRTRKAWTERQCGGCGRMFTVSTRHKNQKNCSLACGIAARRSDGYPRRKEAADYHHWSSADDAVLRAAYERGDDTRDIAMALGVSPLAIRNRAKGLGQRHRRKTRTLEQRFWDYVSCEPNSGCWLWEGSCHRLGYGQLRISLNGRNTARAATQISLELSGRQRLPGMGALHTCDNPPCVNPDHLFWGTQKDNTADAIAKGRATKPPIARKGQGRITTHCRAGHVLADVGVHVSKNGIQACKLCRTLAKIAMRARFKAAGLTTRGTVPVAVS